MAILNCLLILFNFIFSVSAWFYGRAEPNASTEGGIWPLPQSLIYHPTRHFIHPNHFRIDAGEHSKCDIITAAIEKYMHSWLFPGFVNQTSTIVPSIGFLRVLHLTINQPCPHHFPQQDMNETYNLIVPDKANKGAYLYAEEVWGALRGLESFSQLIYWRDENEYRIRSATIHDWPRFKVRGLMVDSSRHFLSVDILKQQIDLMSQNKMNLFHWHIVDSEAFPYQSERFPELSKQGAYSPRHVYTPADVRDIVAYARLRGIRVMPEFDTPGHTGSWIGQPGLLTDCYHANGSKTNLPNLLDPTRASTYDFLEELFKELATVFPERFLHLGGDEVSDYINECWIRNPIIRSFMEDVGYGHNMTLLENHYFARLFKLVKKVRANTKMVFWQEVFDNNNPEPGSVVHIWKGNTLEEVFDSVRNVTDAGFETIVSACWYLNYIKYGADWKEMRGTTIETNARYYYCDPHDFDGTEEQKALVLGGIAAMWGEFVDATNIVARIWPRASAIAERLWSDASQTTDADEAWPRLHELRCRLLRRGYRAEPVNYPDFCPFEWTDPLP